MSQLMTLMQYNRKNGKFENTNQVAQRDHIYVQLSHVPGFEIFCTNILSYKYTGTLSEN